VAKFKVATGLVKGPRADLGGAKFVMEREALDAIDAEIVEVDASSEAAFIAGAKDADAIIGRGIRLTPSIIEKLDKCKIIAGSGVGFDYVDVPAATKKGVVVTNVPDTFIEEVADHAMTLLLACWRQIILQDRIVREGRWDEGRGTLSLYPRLRGLTLGLVGFGNIPRLVTVRAKAFGLHVIAYDPFIHEHAMTQYDVEPIADLVELMRRSDFVSMHVPLSPATKGMLTEKHFRAMKKTGIFISTGRGPTVDEKALIKALQEKWFLFAGLDVFEQEPINKDNPLLKLQNVVVAPHAAGGTFESWPRRAQFAFYNMQRVWEGKAPESVVTEE
jgi:D-3-phosphoglycerate dehydrogenase